GHTTPFTHASLIKDQEIKKPPKVLRSSIESDPNLVDLGNNSFVQSAFKAYSQHLHLVIRPDDVWLALLTQFSIYVNANSDQLRSKVVPFDDKRELIAYIEGISTEPMDRMTGKFSDLIAENIKDPSIREWVLPSFTTTTNNDRVVGTFALMSTLKSYFNYTVRSRCGLPKVTMMGTVDDWKQVRQRAERLIEFDLKDNLMSKWLDMLLPVLDNLVMSAEGKPDTVWWNRIANKVGRGSGVSNLSGWITTFIPFTNKGVWNGDHKHYQNFGIDCPKVATTWPVIDTANIPCGYLTCPLTVQDKPGSIPYETDIYAGHIVSKLTNDNNTIIPQLDWCILLK
ncbi:hypothetical protein SAMD00019534_064710, partial [Acytostelium subglobosum LB1]|uniref:hypothetical protein n=1 Tax=Acytostelium subglobosum LB1 TaxID=1410327 RepID=UPI0006451709